MKNIVFALVTAMTLASGQVHARLCSANKADHGTPKEYKVYDQMSEKVLDWYDATKSDANNWQPKRAIVRLGVGTPLTVANGLVKGASIATDQVERVFDTVMQSYEDVKAGGTVPEYVAFVTVDPVSKLVHFTTINTARTGALALEIIDATQANIFDSSSELFVDISDMLASGGKAIGGDVGETAGNVVGLPFVVAAFVMKGAEWVLTYVLIDYGVNLVLTTGDEVGELVCDVGDTLGHLVRLEIGDSVESLGDSIGQVFDGGYQILKAVVKPVGDVVDLLDRSNSMTKDAIKKVDENTDHSYTEYGRKSRLKRQLQLPKGH